MPALLLRGGLCTLDYFFQAPMHPGPRGPCPWRSSGQFSPSTPALRRAPPRFSYFPFK